MGIFRIDPPIYLFVSLAAIVVLHLFFPGVRAIPAPWKFLGFVLILLGSAVLTGSLTPFPVVFVFLVFMDTVFIRFEDKKFAQTFGDTWLDYRADVLRWI